MRYLTALELLIIHAKIIDETGGSHGVRDISLFVSLINRPKAKFGGKELYHGIFQKAAAYLESIVGYHVFVDGNKRTGIVATARFLFLNGFKLNASNKQLERFVLNVATKKFEIEVIAKWLKEHSQKIKEIANNLKRK